MGRRIIYRDDVIALGDGRDEKLPVDNYLERIVKYIPAEIITLYVALAGIIEAAKSPGQDWYRFGIFIFGVLVTPLYIWRVSRDPSLKARPKQFVVSTFSFIVWALATDAPLKALGFDAPLLTALLLPAFTFLVGLF